MGLMLKKPEHVAGSAAPAIIVGLFVAFGGILFGYVAQAELLSSLADSITVMTLEQLVVFWLCHIG